MNEIATLDELEVVIKCDNCQSITEWNDCDKCEAECYQVKCFNCGWTERDCDTTQHQKTINDLVKEREEASK